MSTPLPVGVVAPLASPCDTVTIAPCGGEGWCQLSVWDERGVIRFEARLERRHATPEIVERLLACVRGWREDGPDQPLARGPRLIR